MARCVIIGAGEAEDLALLKLQIHDDDYIVCVDNGYLYAQKMGIIPDVILGDFDSYKGDVPTGNNVKKYNPIKDDSDTMLAIKTVIEKGFKKVLMLAMLGGRLDHTYANIQSAVYAEKHGVDLTIWSKDCIVHAIKNREIEIPYRFGYVPSVFSLNEVSVGVNIKNAKYPLENYTLKNDVPLGLSNAFLNEEPIKVSVQDGILVIITSKEN